MNDAHETIEQQIAPAIADVGGRAYYVGGYVRDRLCGREPKDVDVEVHGLPLEALEKVLGRFGVVDHVGRSFGVLKVRGVDADFSLPRKDTKVTPGHRGFDVTFDPNMGFEEASRRRDFTVNSIGMDVITGEVLDPHGGSKDLAEGALRQTDATHFGEDPLRGLRAAQLIARFDLTPTTELVALCRKLDLSELPGERFKQEFDKLLLRAKKPSRGFAFLRETRLLRFFPELEAMIGCEQDPEWHPEGDVWTHVMMVVDAAARIDAADTFEKQVIMYGALCHDLGKPLTTVRRDGRLRSPGHPEAGVEPAEAFLARLSFSRAAVNAVLAMVLHHMQPGAFYKQASTDKAYRKLAYKLAARGTQMSTLEKVARADFRGRTTDDATGVYDAGDHFLERAEALAVVSNAPDDVVLGRHLIARGMTPSPAFTDILDLCREIQYETGWADPDRILKRALKNRP